MCKWLLIFSSLALLIGCAPQDAPGCRNDADCRADRICVAGLCQDPEGAQPDDDGRAPEEPGPDLSLEDERAAENNGASPADLGDGDPEPPPDLSEGEPDLAPDLVADLAPDLPPEPDMAPDLAPDLPDEEVADLPDPDPVGPRMVITPSDALRFGEVEIYREATQAVTVANTGDRPLRLTQAALEAPGEGFFVTAPALPLSLNPNQQAQIEVRFAPRRLDFGRPLRYANALLIEGDDPEAPRARVALEGTAILLQTPPQAITVTLTWDNGADLDLHLVRSSNAEFPRFGSQRSVQFEDCYFNNLTPDWGRPNDPTDNPRHFGDDRDGRGPETIVYNAPEPGRRYMVGVLYAQRNDTEEVEAEVRVRVGAQERTFEAEWSETIYWLPVIIEPDGSLTEVDEFRDNRN